MQPDKLLYSLINSRLAASIFLFLISFLIFIPSLKNDFVWDDIPYILDRIEYLTISHQVNKALPKTLSEDKKRAYYRPALHISLAADNEIWKGKAFGFHLTNVVMHSVSTVLLFLLILLISKELSLCHGREIAIVSSLLYALHPIHVETVSFIMARSDLLCAMFVYCFFIFYIKSYEKVFYLVPSLFFFCFALLSKEVAFVFPVLVVVYDLLRPKQPLSKYIARYSVCMILFLVYIYFRSKAFVVVPEFSYSVIDPGSTGISKAAVIVQNFLNAYGFYVYKLFFPFDFNVSAGRLPVNFSFIVLCFSLIISLGLFLYRKYRFNSFAVILIILTLAPAVFVSVLDVVSSPYAERFLYIPSAGFCMVLGYLFVTSKWRFKLPKYSVWTAIVLVCLLYGVFTVKEQFVWKNNYTLWKKAVQRSPEHPMPRLNYGYSLIKRGDIDGAITEFTKAAEYEKDYNKSQKALAYNNLGTAYLNKGDFKKAEDSFRMAFKSDPKYKSTYHYHLGLIYYLKGEKIYLQNRPQAQKFYAKALKYLKKANRKARSHRRLHLILAEVYLRQSNFKAAHKYAEASLKPGKFNLDARLRDRAKYILELSKRYM
ncbi:MAG: tetratricopeptide repeat protein [Candidatus Dadabacteria bacterium]|nr:tetratricopeptide repeat protein [Candidatus Dadabacteria bacterium]NIS08848.1 tetratricopeptide repeat protein [Candidatus Dadabacteria bacterium]NIV42798.1 tetratricopeptide repeat protein [Candidatus Dadabacteria bacterium]NIX16111.1 tetratricopeptide repeat protein [Candidatus Dadabacteria bacterium]NIY22198.1 tetratricopeptide repeat protein [Candidatus Dadabacteria bacterium]